MEASSIELGLPSSSALGADVAPESKLKSSDCCPLSRLGWPIAFVCALALFYMTASRAIQWQDQGQFVLRIATGDILDPFGLALTHPLHFWIGRAVVLLGIDPVFAVPMVSAVCGAIVVANTFGIVRQLTGRLLPALFAATGLAVAHTFWHMSTVAEVYTMSAAMLSIEVWAVVRWDATRRPQWLVLIFFANGLGLAVHNLALLTLPVVGILLLLAMRARLASWRTLLAAGVAWFIGASPYLGLVLQQIWVSGNAAATIRSALVGNYGPAVAGHNPALLRYTAFSIAFTLLSFPNLMLPTFVVGAVRARAIGVPRITYRVLLADLIMHLGFVLRYAVIDQYTFLVSSYFLIALFAGIGFEVVWRLWPRQLKLAWFAIAGLALVMTPLDYFLGAEVARHFHVLGKYARNKPYRDDYRYLFLPWGRGEISAARMSRQAVDLAGDHGLLIVEDEMGSFAVDYERFRAHRLGIEVMQTVDPARVEQAANEGRAVVLVPSTVDKMPVNPMVGAWVRNGDIYLLATGRSGSPPAPQVDRP